MLNIAPAISILLCGFALAGGAGCLSYGRTGRHGPTIAFFACASFALSGFAFAVFLEMSSPTPGAALLPIHLTELFACTFMLLLPLLYGSLCRRRPGWPEYLIVGFYLLCMVLALVRPAGYEWDQITDMRSLPPPWTGFFPEGRHSSILLTVRIGHILVLCYCIRIAWRGWRNGQNDLWTALVLNLSLGSIMVYFLGDALGAWHITSVGVVGTELSGATIYFGLFSCISREERQGMAERLRTQASLSSRERQLQDIAANVPGVLYEFAFRSGGKIEFSYISPRSLNVIGLKPDPDGFFELLTASIADEDRERFLASLLSAGREGAVWEFEGHLIKSSHEIVHIRTHAIPLPEEANTVYKGLLIDVTNKEKPEEQLRKLQEVSLLLSRSDTPDTLCRRAIELGRERLGFDRLSLWLITDDPNRLEGTYGTDEAGNTRTEIGRTILSTVQSRQMLFADQAVHVREEGPHSDDPGEWIGHSWHMTAVLRDGADSIGVLNADNHLHHRPLQKYQIELLGLYGATVGHLYMRLQKEKALRASEAQFRAIFVEAAIGIALVDLDGYPTMCNRALVEMLGYSEEELRRTAFTEFTHPDDIDLDWTLFQDLAAGKRDSYQIEKRFLRKDGEVIWGRLVVSLVRDPEGTARFGIGMAENVTERKLAEQNLRDTLQRLHTLADHLQSIREEERTRVAREVHDELGQALTGLKFELAWLKRHTAAQMDAAQVAELSEKMVSMNDLIEQTIKSVRRITTELRPVVLDMLGLVPALEWQAGDFQNRTGITCSFSSNLEATPLDAQVTTAVFRITQESLTNVMRHAGATRVWISLDRQEGSLILTIQDNGVGIEENSLRGEGSFGLLGMRERARLLGGSLQIEGIAGEGTTVRLEFPFSAGDASPAFSS